MTYVGVLAPGKRKALKLLRAFVKSSDGRVLAVERIRKRHVDINSWVFYGVDLVTLPFFELAKRRGNFVYIDNGYLCSKYHGAIPPYYRVTRGAAQHSGIGMSDGERFAALDVEIKPWRGDGDHVLIAMQSAWWFERHGIDREQWLAQIVEFVREHTGRPIRIREKPVGLLHGAAVANDLTGAWCVVTHASNVAVDAIIAGVPAVVLGPSAAAPMAGSRLEHVIDPPMPAGRLEWCGVLADNQWTIQEITAGMPLQAVDPQGVARGNG